MRLWQIQGKQMQQNFDRFKECANVVPFLGEWNTLACPSVKKNQSKPPPQVHRLETKSKQRSDDSPSTPGLWFLMKSVLHIPAAETAWNFDIVRWVISLYLTQLGGKTIDARRRVYSFVHARSKHGVVIAFINNQMTWSIVKETRSLSFAAK